MSGIHQMLLGGATKLVQARGGALSATVASGPVTVEYRMLSTGATEGNQGGSIIQLGNWIVAGSPANFEVRATVTAGGTPSGSAVGGENWLPLGSNQSWAISASGNQFVFAEVSSTLLIEIRYAGTSFVQSSASVSLYAASGSPG